MVAKGGEGGSWLSCVDLRLRVGCLEGFCRSLSGCLGSLGESQRVGIGNLGDLGLV